MAAAAASAASHEEPRMVTIMGTIAAGKSTLISRLRDRLPGVVVVEEPLDLFTDVHGHGNLLKMLYENPKFAAGPFQQVAMYGLARAANAAWRAARHAERPVRALLLERCIIDTHEIFSRQQQEDGNITGVDIGVEQEAFETLCECAPWVWPRAIVYLETSAERSWERMLARGRAEEVGGTPEQLAARRAYLARLCARYDDVVARLESGALRSPWGARTPVFRVREGEDAIAAVLRACEHPQQ